MELWRLDAQSREETAIARWFAAIETLDLPQEMGVQRNPTSEDLSVSTKADIETSWLMKVL